MLKKRPFIRIILIFIIGLTGLILIWPAFHDTYLGFIIWTGNRYLSSPGKDVLVKFKENDESKDPDLMLLIGNKVKMDNDIRHAYWWVTKARTFYIAWIELALMIALILASPVPFLRKMIVLVAGILFVHLTVFLKLLIQIYFVCNHNQGLDILVLSPSQIKWIDLLQDQFVDTVQPTLILVIITWILITFTVKDYKKLMVSKTK